LTSFPPSSLVMVDFLANVKPIESYKFLNFTDFIKNDFFASMNYQKEFLYCN
jgi:hypothetical protein